MINIKSYFLLFFINTVLIVIAFMSKQVLILLPALIVVALILTVRENDGKIMFLLYFLPFSNIFKIDPTSFSLFTLFEVAYIISIFFRKKSFNIKHLLLIITYSLYITIISIGNPSFPWVLIINNIMWLLILSFALKFRGEKSFKYYTVSFTLGIIASSIVGLFSKQIPRINYYTIETTIYNSNLVESVSRFSGLWEDPNILAVFILITLPLLTLLNLSKKISNLTYYTMTGVLVIFGLMTLSKMFFLGLFTFVILNLIILVKKKKGKGLILFSIVTTVVCFIVMTFASSIVDTYMYRFSGIVYGDTTMSEFTTKRNLIWEYYYNSLKESGRWLFGHGLEPLLPYGRAAHNTIIQFIYLTGVVGMLFYIFIIVYFTLSSQSEKIKRAAKSKTFIALKFFPLLVLLWGLTALDLYNLDFFIFFILLSSLHYIESGEN